MEVSRIIDILPHIKETYNRKDVLSYKSEGTWHSYDIDDFILMANDTSYGLIASGILPQDKVAIISANCPEWNFADFGIAQIGAVSVPIYPTLSALDTAFILNDAEVKIIFVENEALFEKVMSVKDKTPTVQKVFTFKKTANYPHWLEIVNLGKGNIKPQLLENLKLDVKRDDLLTLIYTSGTTGTPKGVMLTHDNLISNVLASREVCPVRSQHKALSFLPLCHIFERMLAYLYMYVGAGIYYAESMDTIADNLREVKPFAFSTVPRLLEKVYDRIVAKGNELTGVKKSMFFWALELGHRYELDGANGWWYETQLKIANKLIFNKWREALGGEVGVIVSGAAALQPRLARVFTAAQIPVLEGYGLTETSPVITVNRLEPGKRAFGSVGPPIREVDVKIAEDGEVLCKGPNVMKGYYKRPDLTADVIVNGWFHTGDIGVMEHGLLRITDRKKEIFKTSGGKYIAPQVMENKFKESIYIEQLMVVGEGKKHPSALIVPAFLAIKAWGEKEGIQLGDNESISKNPKVIDLIQKEVDRLNENFSHYEKIKKFCLLPEEWSVATTELTPKLSLRRKVIMEKYHQQVEAFYKNEE